MALSNPFVSLFCPIRKRKVSRLPEEIVRQALIQEMIHQLGYPQESLVLEKSLGQLPHLACTPNLPTRRTDLLVLTKNIHLEHPLYPLLLVECKAIPLTNKVLRQIIGYNQFVRAYFIAVVNQTATYFGWFDQNRQDFIFQEGLPPYQELISRVQ